MSTAASLERAAALLGKPIDGDVVLLKIVDPVSGCACFHCWPETWAAVNEHLGPQGPIEDEGDLLVSGDGCDIVLECHESGPEVVVYIEAATAVVSLVAAVAGLTAVVLAARARERGGSSTRPLRLRVTQSTRGRIDQETSIELEMPASPDAEEAIASLLEDVMRPHTEQAFRP